MLDLFAGAGGWDVAARDLGLDVLGVEKDPWARATRSAAGLETIHPEMWTLRTPEHEGQVASPPCQTFSTAGSGDGMKALEAVQALIGDIESHDLMSLRFAGTRATGDERTALVLAPLLVALGSSPRWIAWEQVPTVLPVWAACAPVLASRGYHVWTGILHAEQYGVPQTRRRAFLLASREHEVTPPRPTHSRYHTHRPERLDPGVAPWVSMATALGWDPNGEVVSNYRTGGPQAPRARRSVAHPAATVTSKVNRNLHLDSTGSLPQWCHERPSTTVVSVFRPEVIAAPGYRTKISRQDAPDSVRVSPTEAGILQSFDPDFPWCGPKSARYAQVGNAIPPLLAKAVLGSVI